MPHEEAAPYAGRMAATLVIIRHAKSDWGVTVADRNRPLGKRGRRQAPATGRWIAEHVEPLDLAVVSVAARTQQTWELVSEELDGKVQTRLSEEAYTFNARELLELVIDLPASATRVALVSHNPAVEELIERLTGEWVPMTTSAVAVVELSDWVSAGLGQGRLVVAGRPADDTWHVRRTQGSNGE